MDPSTGCRVLFTVQELMTGSIDQRLWHQPTEAVSWCDRLRWATDTAEASYETLFML